MQGLTSAQTKALEYIQNNVQRIGSPPTLRELCQHMGYKAIGSAQDVVAALRKKGYLESPDRQAARSLIPTEKARRLMSIHDLLDDNDSIFRIPCLGMVPAGNPMEAIEEKVDTLRMSVSMLPRPLPRQDELFALRTDGESMIEAGILDGDWLVVKVQKEADPGSVVIARLGDDVTCKRLMHDIKRGWYLKPENPKFPLIFAKDEPFEIVGTVVALQRSF